MTEQEQSTGRPGASSIKLSVGATLATLDAGRQKQHLEGRKENITYAVRHD